MTRRAWFALALLGGAAHAAPLTVIRSTDFLPNPAFRPLHPNAHAEGAGPVEQIGEVAILQGDDTLVSDGGSGRYGIAWSGETQNPPEITKRFFTAYPDEFDAVVVFTTFTDHGARGALAYEISTKQTVRGLGQMRFDDTDNWGGKNLYSFINMMRWDQWPDMDGLPLTDPRSVVYSTLGQEFAHRWLSFLRYKNRAGVVSQAMLGRDKAHWASTLQAFGSVMDGQLWSDNKDGTF
ncbi:MAG: hypothetical protein FJZ00_14355, partial [Candidatus Sericytochromatia bacterium]|nr:hypothetical protein [Candidatus Tanganyikabacteria bacterium]